MVIITDICAMPSPLTGPEAAVRISGPGVSQRSGFPGSENKSGGRGTAFVLCSFWRAVWTTGTRTPYPLCLCAEHSGKPLPRRLGSGEIRRGSRTKRRRSQDAAFRIIRPGADWIKTAALAEKNWLCYHNSAGRNWEAGTSLPMFFVFLKGVCLQYVQHLA